MGTQITEIIAKREIKISELKRKIVAVDAYNQLYMFLTTIRGYDGSVLSDSKGRTTSHLVGLFSRLSNWMAEGLKPVYVFDGKVPELKFGELERRKEVKKTALLEYGAAKDKEDVEGMRKFAGRTSKLTKEMVEQAKLMLDAMGIPWIQAPTEGEAQASYLVKKGDAYAVISQDADCLLFGADRMIRNLSVSGRRKVTGKLAYTSIEPEIIDLRYVLNDLEITREQLIVLSMLVGTDYNPKGIKGIGPKKALQLVKANTFEQVMQFVKWDEFYSIPWKTIYDTIHDMPVTDDYSIKFRKPDEVKLKEFLMDFDFSEQRVDNALKKINADEHSQTGLGEFT